MNFGNLLYNLQEEERSSVRKIEKVSKKLISAQYAVIFNNICIKENLLPKYTDIRPHDPAVRRSEFTLQYRRDLLLHQLEKKEKQIKELEIELHLAKGRWDSYIGIGHELRHRIEGEMEDIINQYQLSTKARILKKLTNLNQGLILIPQPKEGYINLSNAIITPDQQKLLNLGLNCHTQRKENPLHKRVEIEVLIDDVLELQKSGKVTISDTLIPNLLAESGKTRGSTKSRILNKTLMTAAKELRENNDIVIRRADKSAVYVILAREEYLRKMNEILSDPTKFRRTTKYTSTSLKTKVNKIIDAVNAKCGGTHLLKIVGDFKPGYAYGNVKTHKINNPLRPIISQIPTPTYQLAKRLNQLISPYVPKAFSVKSPTEFIDLLNRKSSQGHIASMDVSSLFTNVPVDETIEMIIGEVYHGDKQPLDIPENLLRQLLSACTKEAPFRGPDGQLYFQVDGVAMGSPLGVLFADFYMGVLERRVMENEDIRPLTYCRYIDDIFVEVKSLHNLQELKAEFERFSPLNFTFEISNDDSLPFLDVMVTREANKYRTTVYTKKTNTGMCMNASSECPDRYKRSVIVSYVKRAFTHCSSWPDLHNELQRLSQTLVNNGYSINHIQDVIRKHMHHYNNGYRTPIVPTRPPIKLYYRNYMSTAYKTDERVINNIVKRGVIPVDTEDTIQFVIYYKNRKTSNLIMKNNTSLESSDLSKVGVIYRYSCPIGDCKLRNVSYIGMTTTTLSRRLTSHLQNGTPKMHTLQVHGSPLTREMLVNNTIILDNSSDKKRLQLKEALYICKEKPLMNIQIGTSSVPLPSHSR